MPRNRIVINLDPNQAGARRRGSGRGIGKPLLIIAIILLLIIVGLAAGGFFWWRSYQSSPTYALAVLTDAAQRDDTATVDSLLDIQKIGSDFTAQVRQRVPTPSVPSSLLPSQADAIKSSASAKLNDTIHEQLVKEIKDLTAAAAAGKPFVLIAVAAPRYVDMKQTDKTAQATVNIKDEQIQLTMQTDGSTGSSIGGWKIVAVKDDKLAKMVGEAIMKSAPSTGTQIEDQIKRQLDRLHN
jgi:hypothetical protein